MATGLDGNDHRLGPTELIWLLLVIGVVITVITSAASLAENIEKSWMTVAAATAGGIALILLGSWERRRAQQRANQARERLARAERRVTAKRDGTDPMLVNERDFWQQESEDAQEDLFQAERDITWAKWTLVIGILFASYSALVGLLHITVSGRRATV